MRQRIILFIFSILCFAGCSQIDEDHLFNYPVETIADIAITDTLSAVQLLEDADLTSFIVVDSFVLSYLVSGNDFLSVTPIFGEEPPLRFCSKGRGPGEFAMMAPGMDYHGGRISVVDNYYRKYYSLNLVASIDSSKTIVDKEVGLLRGDNRIWPVMSVFQIGADSLLLRYAANNPRRNGEEVVPNDLPDYQLIDLNDGTPIEDYFCFNDASLKIGDDQVMSASTELYLYDCINEARDRICFAMVRTPQVGFLDVKSGRIHGVRLKGQPQMNRKRAFLYFLSVASYDDRIYALYSGEKEVEGQFPKSPSTLYVFDWEGNIKAKYMLDAPYRQCYVTESGVYLSKWEENLSLGLYRIQEDILPR
ncbi:MAG: hypothetical protein J5939_01455 [Bacteroidales bacterium]|nr:hypothetical protein [Bacteroidales bacterium]